MERAVTIPAASVRALHAEPYTVVPLAGTSKCLILDAILVEKPAGDAYADVTAAGDLVFRYVTGGLVGCLGTYGFLDSPIEQTRWVWAYRAGSGVSSFAPIPNASIIAQLLNGEVTAGGPDLKLRVLYRIVGQ